MADRITEPQLADALKGMSVVVEDDEQGTEGTLRHPIAIARDVFYLVFKSEPPAPVADPELRAMATIAGALTGLDNPDAVTRILRYFTDRYIGDEIDG